MFITVRFGDHQTAIFNPNCRTYNLLSHIKEKCECNTAVDIELCDPQGNVKFLRDIPDKSASDVLPKRENFILLQVEKTEAGLVKYKPLIQDKDVLTDEFLKRLSKKGRQNRPASRGKRQSSAKRSPSKESKKELKVELATRQSRRESPNRTGNTKKTPRGKKS
ncbi:unnamed protein product [Owenia fusiformis]|uniref:Uncharacterized protein n=1 Tax=Owenia fusiformis TaxID=6347 RepID=A0A8J1TSN9_OWEFU|nr:unnamed protein product [Owenia fusiformis]